MDVVGHLVRVPLFVRITRYPETISCRLSVSGRGVSGNLRPVRVWKSPSGPRLKFEHPVSGAKTQATPRRPRACSPSCCGRRTDAHGKMDSGFVYVLSKHPLPWPDRGGGADIVYGGTCHAMALPIGS